MLELGIDLTRLEAGCDEAGRGCLAGPVTAAAVILDNSKPIDQLNDSKKLSAKKREMLRPIIEERALAWAVAMIWPSEIDEINILNASIKAMHVALDKLTRQPDYILVDGNKFKHYKDIPHETVVKGDGKYANIAAASILAKTHRDEYMCSIHDAFPMYNWAKNMGYPTVEHREAVLIFGTCTHHRKTFRITNPQLQLW